MNLCLKGAIGIVEEMTHIDTHKPQRKQKVFRERGVEGVMGSQRQAQWYLVGEEVYQ